MNHMNLAALSIPASQCHGDELSRDLSPWMAAALNDLVERLVDQREQYPKNGRFRTSMVDILSETDSCVLANIMVASLDDFGLRDRIARIVRDYIQDTTWHVDRAEDMQQAARDEMGDYTAERR